MPVSMQLFQLAQRQLRLTMRTASANIPRNIAIGIARSLRTGGK
jgi:hypothetical protein